MENLVVLLVFLLTPNIISMIVAFFCRDNLRSWFDSLQRPKYAPPNWVFAPVWIVLYAMIGYSGYLVFSIDNGIQSYHWFPWTSYFSQLSVNYLWYIAFFGMRNLLGSLYVIFVLICLILMNITAFYFISKVAAYLLLPYLFWVAFATYLNFEFWNLNKEDENSSYRRISIEDKA